MMLAFLDKLDSLLYEKYIYFFISVLCLCLLRKHKWPSGILGRGPSKRIPAS